MSYDLILKRSNINWARGGVALIPSPTAPTTSAAVPGKLACTPEEKAKLIKIAAVKRAAGKSDKKAKAQWENLLAVGIPALKAKAAKGDPKAKRDLQCLKASGLFATPAAVRGEFIGAYSPHPAASGHVRQLIQLARQGNRRAQGILSASRISWVQGEFIGDYPTQILGSDLNDDELAVAQEGGSSERQALARVRGDFIGLSSEVGRRRRRRGKRTQHLKKIVKKAAQGDTNALNQMQQVQQRLSQRAASGDPRANTLLQRINQWYTQYQSQYQSTAQTQYPAYPQPYQTPYGTPYSPSQQPYSPYPGAPGAPGDDEQELATTDPEL
jgi:hypothetical protein